MIDFVFDRRSFLRIGGISAAMSQIGLTDSVLSQEPSVNTKKTVVWVWLGGGPTQFETFHAPTKTVPKEWEPVNGYRYDKNTDINLGGDWFNLYGHTSKLNVVNSFSHNDSSHKQGTHFVMTGHYNDERADTAMSKYPSFGSIVSACFGANNTENGVPTYVRQGTIDGDEASWLGGAFKPFDPSNKENLSPRIDMERFVNRKSFLKAIDKARVPGENAISVDFYKNQAYDVILGSAKDAFAMESETAKTKELYGSTKANDIGEQMILARRLSEYGTKFITIHYGGWDMHGNISDGLKDRVPPIDKALSGFLTDVWDRGLNDNILLVVTGEFGRTKLNAGAGRDHWPAITPLLMAGGKYFAGRTIGKSDRAYTPTDSPFGPLDLQATLFDHFEIDKNTQRVDNGGRPRYLLEGDGKNILL